MIAVPIKVQKKSFFAVASPAWFPVEAATRNRNPVITINTGARTITSLRMPEASVSMRASRVPDVIGFMNSIAPAPRADAIIIEKSAKNKAFFHTCLEILKFIRDEVIVYEVYNEY